MLWQTMCCPLSLSPTGIIVDLKNQTNTLARRIHLSTLQNHRSRNWALANVNLVLRQRVIRAKKNEAHSNHFGRVLSRLKDSGAMPLEWVWNGPCYSGYRRFRGNASCDFSRCVQKFQIMEFRPATGSILFCSHMVRLLETAWIVRQ